MTNRDPSGGHTSQQPNPHSRRRTRGDYERGLPGYHDPTAGFGGAAPARSALTLRAVLAGFGLVFCTVAAVVMIKAELVAFSVVLAPVVAKPRPPTALLSWQQEQYLTALDLRSFHAPQQHGGVVAGLRPVEGLAKGFHPSTHTRPGGPRPTTGQVWPL
jgi:hypothetical protein